MEYESILIGTPAKGKREMISHKARGSSNEDTSIPPPKKKNLYKQRNFSSDIEDASQDTLMLPSPEAKGRNKGNNDEGVAYDLSISDNDDDQDTLAPGIIKAKKLNSNATIPYKSSKNAAGYDLTSTSTVEIPPGSLKTIWIRIAVQIPNGYFGQIVIRSGIAMRGSLTILGGVIDSDYTGDIGCMVFNLGSAPVIIESNERFAQLVIIKIHEGNQLIETDNFTRTTRGGQGFGSTGHYKQTSMLDFFKKQQQ